MSKKTAPKLPLHFFRWYCHPDYLEDLEGDLVERFEKRVDEKSVRYAKWGFTKDVVRLCRPGIIRPLLNNQKMGAMDMYRNYFKIASRSLVKHKMYVLINVLGMGFALMCCIVAFLNLDYKLRFDEYHAEKTSDIYRINTVWENENGKEPWGITPLPLGASIAEEVTSIESIVRLHSIPGVVKANNKVFSEVLHYADMALMENFNFPLVYGDISTLKNPDRIVVDEEVALKYFGNESAIGREVNIIDHKGRDKSFIIGAVSKKVPENTSILFDFIVPFQHMFDSVSMQENSWKNPSSITTFVKLNEASNPNDISESLNKYVSRHNQNNKEGKSKIVEFYLQPFDELAFTSDIDMPNTVLGRALNRNAVAFLVGITSILSLLILITACFNFTNTSIAFSGSRLKEIGLRKVNGGSRIQLIFQFMIENVLICVLSIFIGLIGAFFLIDAYNALFEQNLNMNCIFNSRVLIYLVSLPFTVALLAGIYPAYKISGYNPVSILKGKTRFTNIGKLSKILLTAQFTVACFSLIGSIILTQNASYQEEVDFGYDLKNIIVAQLEEPAMYSRLEQELSHNPKINSMAGSAQIAGSSSEVSVKSDDDIEYKTRLLLIGSGYLETVGIDLVNGRDFITSSSEDLESSVIINQEMARLISFENSPIGELLIIEDEPHQIIGLAENHKEYGLMGEEPPCIFKMVAPNDYRYLNLSTLAIAEVSEDLMVAWFKVNPDVPLSAFPQQMLADKQFKITSVLKNLCLFLTTATIIMAVAGFFSIVSLSVLKRTKEIGIRKVMGGSVRDMIKLITKDFIGYVLLAFTIGSSLGYLAIGKILFSQVYAYHISLGLGVFILTLLIMLLVPGLTIGYKVWKAAITNPADSLRNE